MTQVARPVDLQSPVPAITAPAAVPPCPAAGAVSPLQGRQVLPRCTPAAAAALDTLKRKYGFANRLARVCGANPSTVMYYIAQRCFPARLVPAVSAYTRIPADQLHPPLPPKPVRVPLREIRAAYAEKQKPVAGIGVISCRTCSTRHFWAIPCPKCCGRFGDVTGPLLGVASGQVGHHRV